MAAVLRCFSSRGGINSVLSSACLPRLGNPLLCSSIMPCSKVSTVAKAKTEMHDFWVRNETLKRPLTPHLTIWQWQLPMNMSLGHRVTGCAMTTVLYVFGYGIFLLPGDYSTYLNMVKDLSVGPLLITSAKFLLSFPLAFHFFNGLRHLSWDLGKGFQMKTIYLTGWLTIFVSAVVAALMTQL